MISLDRINCIEIDNWTGYEDYIERGYLILDSDEVIHEVNICSIIDKDREVLINGYDVNKEKIVEYFPLENIYPKVVRFNTNRYGYIDAKGHIYPYRFDYATDFNSFGLAMACLNGKVFWMNKNFKFLRSDNFKFSCAFNLLYLNGSDKVYNFDYSANTTLIEYGYYDNGVYKKEQSSLTWNPKTNSFIPDSNKLTLKKSKNK